jgi:hypothetical protein
MIGEVSCLKKNTIVGLLVFILPNIIPLCASPLSPPNPTAQYVRDDPWVFQVKTTQLLFSSSVSSSLDVFFAPAQGRVPPGCQTENDEKGGLKVCHTANEGPVRIQYKCLVPIFVFREMKLHGLVISKI